jgi:hypothetical protein
MFDKSSNCINHVRASAREEQTGSAEAIDALSTDDKE